MKKRNRLFTYTLTLLLCGGLLLTSCDLATSEEDNTTESSEATHVHSFSESWESDSTHHWHECECGEVFDSFGEHTFSYTSEGSENHLKTCAICGYSISESHSLVKDESKSKEATCGTEGVNAYYCSLCEYTNEVVVPASGVHFFDEGKVVLEPTCSKEGICVYTCIECGFQQEETIDKLPHTYSEEGHKGYEYYDETYCWRVCSICGEGDESTIVEHNLYPYIGYNEEGHFYHCMRCDASINFEAHVLADDWTYTYESTDDDYLYHWKTCSFCGYTIKEHHDIYYWDTEIGFHRRGCYTCDWCSPYEAHEYETTGEVVESTCSENGYYVQHCVYCGCDAHVSLDLDPNNHTYVKEVTEPTCLEAGYTTHTCSGCGYSYIEPGSRALGHSYGDYTDLGDGTHCQVCTRCGEKTTPQEHTHSTSYDHLDPTCTESGYQKFTCLDCGASIDETLAALGHTYTYTYDDTYHTGTCIRCSATVIEAHSYENNAITISGVDGHYASCDVCDYGGDEELIPHTYNEETGICLVCEYEFPYSYEIENNQITITGFKSGVSSLTSVEIPSYFNSYPVTKLYNNEARLTNTTRVKTLTLPETLKEIGNRAFYLSSSSATNALTSVNFNEGLEYIGDYAFYNNAKLNGDLSLPDSLISVGADAFYHDTSLTSIEIGTNLETLGHNAFYYCSGVETITMTTNKLEVIPNSCFQDCRALTYIEIPASVTSIEDAAFNDCRELHDIILPVSVTRIGEHVFGSMSTTSSTVCLKNVYYMGLPSDLASIEIASNQSSSGLYVGSLDDASWYYYDEAGAYYQTDTGNQYWHYVEGKVQVWEA